MIAEFFTEVVVTGNWSCYSAVMAGKTKPALSLATNSAWELTDDIRRLAAFSEGRLRLVDWGSRLPQVRDSCGCCSRYDAYFLGRR